MGKIEQLSEKIMQQLLREIRDGDFREQDILPTEIELAQRYHVSRNVMRESLIRMEREGWLTRKHGVGTLINRSIVRLKTRFDLNYELRQTLELNGKHARSELIGVRFVSANAEIAPQLAVAEGEELLRVTRLLRADGDPAVFCIDYLPTKQIRNRSYDPTDLEAPMSVFLHDFCRSDVVTRLSELRSVPATEEVAAALKVPKGSGLLFVGEVGYDLRSNPILYSEEYFIDRVIRHMIVRKKI